LIRNNAIALASRIACASAGPVPSMMYSTALNKRVAVLIGDLGAQQEAVGTERVDGTAQYPCVAMAYGVVPQPVHGLTWRLLGVRCLPRDVVVCPPRNHRQRTPRCEQMILTAGYFCRCPEVMSCIAAMVSSNGAPTIQVM